MIHRRPWGVPRQRFPWPGAERGGIYGTKIRVGDSAVFAIAPTRGMASRQGKLTRSDSKPGARVATPAHRYCLTSTHSCLDGIFWRPCLVQTLPATRVVNRSLYRHEGGRKLASLLLVYFFGADPLLKLLRLFVSTANYLMERNGFQSRTPYICDDLAASLVLFPVVGDYRNVPT